MLFLLYNILGAPRSCVNTTSIKFSNVLTVGFARTNLDFILSGPLSSIRLPSVIGRF